MYKVALYYDIVPFCEEDDQEFHFHQSPWEFDQKFNNVSSPFRSPLDATVGSEEAKALASLLRYSLFK